MTDSNLLALETQAEGAGEVVLTSIVHNQVMEPVREPETRLITDKKNPKTIPARLRPSELIMDQKVFDTETELTAVPA